MYARIVTIPLKPEKTAKFTEIIEKNVTPMLRTHKGFVDEIAFVVPEGKISYGISFWDTKEHAEAYNRSGYSDVLKALNEVVGGPAQVQLCKVTNSTAHHIAPARVA